MGPRVGVVIVTFNSARHLPGLFASLDAAAPGLDLTCVVVDNDSTDQTLTIAEAAGFPAIVTGGNLGFAAGLNAGRAHLARTVGPVEALAFLNPDLVLTPGSLTRLVTALADGPGIGVVVPRIRRGDGLRDQSLHREPSLPRAVADAVLGGQFAGRWGTTVRDDAAYERAGDVDWASGAAWVVSGRCDADVGDWDESFFLYSEEVDYARRVRERGWRVRFLPDAEVVHEGGGSGRSDALEALQAVNKVRDYGRRHNRATTLAYRAVLVAHHAARVHHPTSRHVAQVLARRHTWSSLPRATR
jgi:N-acetylglucosaminyl-diphospho-decaprenol L-rhamnosyltransferase